MVYKKLRFPFPDKLLGGGATIKEIGQILGHQLPAATEIYAKVDFGALFAIVQPWPGGKL